MINYENVFRLDTLKTTHSWDLLDQQYTEQRMLEEDKRRSS